MTSANESQQYNTRLRAFASSSTNELRISLTTRRRRNTCLEELDHHKPCMLLIARRSL